MSNEELLHQIVNSAHHSKKVNKTYIADVMHRHYNVPSDVVDRTLDRCIQNGTLVSDGRGGYYSTENPEFDEPKDSRKSVGKILLAILTILGGISAILGGIWYAIDFFNRLSN